jgi:hypothetical protein
MSFRSARAGRLGLSLLPLLLLGAAGCSKTADTSEGRSQAVTDPALEAKVLDSVPSDIENRTFVDFEGKVHLIGYAIAPKDEIVSPGSKLKLTLYWRSVAPLGSEWALFTHLIDGAGNKFGNTDNEGPLRRLKMGSEGREVQALPPSAWIPGKIYVDEQEFEIPRDVNVPELTIATGIWREQLLRMQTGDGGVDLQNAMRLAIISGPSDGKQRAIVTHVKTGIVRPVDVRAVAPKQPAT